MFFNSWALWEKMTFVLALAILGVFAIGWGKLAWRNHYVKRQALVDEEKRMKIQELRNSGHIIQSRKSHDIPFGVRAIQSGIQVDGIWISQSATPFPSELKLGYLRNSSSENMASEDSGKSREPLIETSPETVATNSKPQGPQLRSHSPSTTLDGRSTEHEENGGMAQDSTIVRPTYKPRRSSQLRFGSYGGYDEKTLGQLEGKTSPPRKKAVSHRPRGSHQTDSEAESSAADNEQNSGTSSDSDATLSHKKRLKPDGPHQSLLYKSVDRDTELNPPDMLSGKPIRASALSQNSKAEYASVPNEDNELANPFMTPQESPRYAQGLDSTRQSWLENAPATSSHISSSPFVPGELHVNRAVRKVNSGFEVLPAGTFGIPAEFKGKGVDVEGEDSGDKRRSTKLQKQPRNSLSGRQPSGTFHQS